MRGLSVVIAAACAAAMAGDVVLFDAASADVKSVRAQDGASFKLKDGLLTVTTAPSDAYPGVCVSGNWDLSGCGRVEVEFVNGGSFSARAPTVASASAATAARHFILFMRSPLCA